MTESHSRARATGLSLVAVVALSATAGVPGIAGAATTTDLTVSTADGGRLAPGETTTVEIAVANADGGVGAGEFGLEVTNPDVASITDITVLHSPGVTGNTVAGGGQSADIKYSFTDSPDAGEVAVAEVTLRADAAGSTDVELVQHSQTGALAVFDEAGAPYTLDTVGSATLTLEEPTTTLEVGASSVQAVSEGSTITLDASGFSDLGSGDLSYSWTVTDDGGTGLSLTDPTTAQQTFTAPDVLEETTLTFRVEISNGRETETETTTVTVEGSLAPIGPFENAPTDPDSDGTYEDVNGDGSANVADAQALFANADDQAVRNNAEAFDYNDDGTLSVSNTQALFSESTGV